MKSIKLRIKGERMSSLLWKDEISSLTEYIELVLFCKSKMYEEYNDRYGSIKESIKSYTNRLQSLKGVDLSNQSDYEVYENALEIRNSERIINYLTKLQHDNPNEDDWQKIYTKYHSVPGHSFFYRGQFNFDYRLLPSIMRDDEIVKEDYYYHNIKIKCPESFMSKNFLEQLAMMQHHGCNTRLLDVTQNPLVALYFACANFGCSKCNIAEEGAVYFFDLYSDEVSFFDEERVKLLSVLPILTVSDKQTLYEECIIKLRERKRFNIGRNKTVVEKVIKLIQTELPAFKNDIDPLDFLTPVLFEPVKDNARLLKQDGSFVINGLSRDADEAEKKNMKLCWKKLKIHNQEIILEELDNLGINESTLFPEIDNVAHYLKNKSLF